jgi:two-component sensor histidine kinase
VAPELDQEFDPGTLHALRAKVLAQACRAGLSEGRAADVVLAVHELAANAIRHGAGRDSCASGISSGNCVARLTTVIRRDPKIPPGTRLALRPVQPTRRAGL